MRSLLGLTLSWWTAELSVHCTHSVRAQKACPGRICRCNFWVRHPWRTGA
jgi:hypothetical protein